MRKPLAAGLAGVLLLTALPASAAAATRLALPAPTGPYAVGSVDLHLVDHARPDPWVAGTTRELMVTIRYPARSGGGGGPKTPYLAPEAAKLIAEEDARTLGIAAGRLGYAFPTHARSGVPAAGGQRPVVLYSPSAKYPRSVGTAQLEQLASEGFVTVAIDHTHEPAAVEFPGGRVERRVLPSGPDAGRQLIATRVADTRFVLDALETLARGGNPDAGHRTLPAGLSLDVSRIGMFGHSAGGFTTGETMVSDTRLDAGADLDGSMAYSQSNREFGRAAVEGLGRPFLLLSAGDHSSASDPSWQEFLAHQRGPVRTQHMPDGEHFSYTDHQVLLPRLGLDPAAIAPFVGTVDPARSMAGQRAELGAFFGRYLERD